MLSASIQHFSIAHMTPFQSWPQPSAEVKALADSLGQSHKLDPDYSLEIWNSNRKVLNIHWQDGHPVEILSFRRGSWESELLRIGNREPD